MPALGTLCYRFGRIPEARWHAFLEWLAVQGIALEQVAGASVSQEPPLVFVDGTGVGYATPFYAQFYRGAQIRRIRSHIKVVVLGYWQGEVVWFMGASLGGAYADEGRLLEDWLLRYGCGVVGSGALLVGDGLYGHRARLLERIEGVGWLPVVRVRDGVWHQVRAGARKRARARAEAHKWALDARYRIEQVFGVVKGVCGSYVRCRSSRMARVRVWGMLVLWTMVQLVRVGGLLWMWGCVCFACGKSIFRTPSAIRRELEKYLLQSLPLLVGRGGFSIPKIIPHPVFPASGEDYVVPIVPEPNASRTHPHSAPLQFLPYWV
ncbi:MAG: transposase [Fimbriimonadales bacterium]